MHSRALTLMAIAVLVMLGTIGLRVVLEDGPAESPAFTAGEPSLDPAPSTDGADSEQALPPRTEALGHEERVAAASPGSDPADQATWVRERRLSLDDESPSMIEHVLAEAITRAKREREVYIAPNLVERVARHGQVRVIVGRPDGRIALEQRLDGTRHGDTRYFSSIPHVALSVGPEALLTLVESSDVFSIEEDEIHRPSLAATIPHIDSDLAVGDGYDGRNHAIAILDTGVDLDHAFFSDRIVDGACFSANSDCPDGSTSQLGIAAGTSCSFSCGHGTYVAGVALGNDESEPLAGVAPAASLISIQIFSEVEPNTPGAYTSDIVAALDDVYGRLRHSYDVAAVNLSLGGTGYSSESACDAANSSRKAVIDQLRSVGIPTVVSSGNNGYTDLITAPGCISSAISVGATNTSDEIRSFSNSASFLDLLAPGSLVESSRPGGSYDSISGTSISAPHVSGAMAQLLTAAPGASVDDLLSALTTSGVDITDDRNGVITPRIDVDGAIDHLLGAGAGSDGEPVGEADGGVDAVPEAESGCGLIGLELLAPALILRRRMRRSTRA